MLFGKKKKLIGYLSKKQEEKALTTFDTILSDYLSGSLKGRLHELEMKKISIHIDWLSDYALTFKEKSAIITLISKLSRKYFLLPMIKTNPMMQRNLFCRMYRRFIVS